MIVYHDGYGNNVGHVIFSHPQDYDASMNGEHFVYCDETIAFERVHLVKAEDGSFRVTSKRDMPIAAAASPIVLGAEASYSGVPAGAALFVDDVELGEMDGSETFDFTPETSGFYALRFALAGYMDWSTTLEVLGSR